LAINGCRSIHWRHLSGFHFLSRLDWLRQSMPLVALDVKTCELTNLCVSKKRYQALLEALVFPFNLLAAFLAKAVQIKGNSRRQRKWYLPTFRKIESSFPRVLTSFGNKFFRGCPRHSF